MRGVQDLHAIGAGHEDQAARGIDGDAAGAVRGAPRAPRGLHSMGFQIDAERAAFVFEIGEKNTVRLVERVALRFAVDLDRSLELQPALSRRRG